MRNYWLSVVFSGLFLVSLGGCTTTKVTRVSEKEKIDISGGWNDYDAMLVAEEMIEDSLNRPWLGNFTDNIGRMPIVLVGHISNKSHEHIDAGTFVKYLEREMLNSGKIIFVASSQEREALRAEREDQQAGHTAKETMAQLGREKGADFMMIGSIHSIKDELKGKYVILYQINLELINLTSNEKVWIGQKQIKKKVEQKQFSL